MKTFENVASLALANLVAGQLTETKGYYGAGDGGQATYLITAGASTSPLGSPDLPASGNHAALQRVHGVVSVKQFGSRGDGDGSGGGTDGSASNQAAFDFALYGEYV